MGVLGPLEAALRLGAALRAELAVVAVAEVARRTAERVATILERRGRSMATAAEEADALADKEPLLARCYGAAVQGALLGDKRGAGPERLTRPTELKKDDLVAEVHGFNVHASVVVDGRDHARLERLVRYLA
jgi:hypothetical protein